jgi:type VI secretion system secreted protein VgrG
MAWQKKGRCSMNRRQLILLGVLALAVFTLQAKAVTLGSAQSFAVLGASTVTNTGPTTIYGRLGVDPGSAITGFPPGVVTGGSIYGPGGLSNQARSDALIAYNVLAGLPFNAHYLIPTDMGGLTLTPGVYKFDSSAGLTGTLTLDFNGNPNADFVFQIGSTLTTASASYVDVINGGSLSGVYWQVGSSATLGSSTSFAGNIIADQSITLVTTADILCGRAIALNGAVTMDSNLISNNNSAENFGSGRPDFGSYGFSGGTGGTVVPEPITLCCLALGLGTLCGYVRRRKCASSGF